MGALSDYVSAGVGANKFIAAEPIREQFPLLVKANGTVEESFIRGVTFGSTSNISASGLQVSVSYHEASGKYFYFYKDSTDDFGYVVVGTVTGTSITFGAPVAFTSTTILNSNSQGLDSVYDPDTQQVLVISISSTDSTARVRAVSISGDTLSFGTEYVTGISVSHVGIGYDTSVNCVFLAYSMPAQFGGGSEAHAETLLVSGSSLTFQNTLRFMSSGYDGYALSVEHAEGYSTSGVNFIANNSGGVGQVSLFTLSPVSYQISHQTTYRLSHSNTGTASYTKGNSIAWVPSIQRLAVIYGGGTNNASLSADVLSIAGTTSILRASSTSTVDGSGSFNTPFENWYSISCDKKTGMVRIVYPDTGSANQCVVARSFPTATSIGFFDFTVLDTADTDHTSIVSAADTTLAAWSVVSGQAKARLIQESITRDRTKFIGFAKASAAAGEEVEVATPFGVSAGRSGLSLGETYYLSNTDGVTLTAGGSGPKVGFGLSPTELLVLGSNIYSA